MLERPSEYTFAAAQLAVAALSIGVLAGGVPVAVQPHKRVIESNANSDATKQASNQAEFFNVKNAYWWDGCPTSPTEVFT